jgi:hypothetical protein
MGIHPPLATRAWFETVQNIFTVIHDARWTILHRRADHRCRQNAHSKTKPTAMIQSFADKDTEELFQRETNRRFNAVAR